MSLHRTRVISAYHVEKSTAKGWGRVNQQHLHYIQTDRLCTTPYKLFCEGLISQMQVRQQQGVWLIFLMDASGYVLHGNFCKRLAPAGFRLAIEEISHKAWDKNCEQNTFADRSKPIDGVWASRSLETGGFKTLSVGESIGSHSTMIFYVSLRSLVGKFEHRIVKPVCRRLHCKTSSMDRYNKILKELMSIHKMEEYLDVIIEVLTDDSTTPARPKNPR